MHQAPGFYSKRAVVQYSNRSNIATFTLVGVQVLLILDHERGVIQCDVNVRNVLTLSVVKACTGIKFHMRTVLVKK